MEINPPFKLAALKYETLPVNFSGLIKPSPKSAIKSITVPGNIPIIGKSKEAAVKTKALALFIYFPHNSSYFSCTAPLRFFSINKATYNFSI